MNDYVKTKSTVTYNSPIKLFKIVEWNLIAYSMFYKPIRTAEWTQYFVTY